jgi:putative ABC transport system ATP-binding protein
MSAPSTFFHDLAEAAGRRLPAPVVAQALAIALPDGPFATPPATLPPLLLDLARRLDLQLEALPTRLDEAVWATREREPVLLVLRQGEAAELVLLAAEDGAEVTVHRLSGAGHARARVAGADLPLTLAIPPDGIAAAFAVRRIGSRGRDAGQAAHGGRPLRRLFALLAADRGALWTVLWFAVAVGVLGLATPVAVQALVNFVAFGSLVQPVVVLGALLLGCLGLSGAIRVLKSYVVEILQRRVFVRVVSDMARRLPRVRLDAYDRGFGPELVNRFFDVVIVQKAVSTLMIDGLDMVLQAGIGLLLLGFYHPYLLVFDLALILAILLILLGIGRNAVATAIQESKVKYEVAGALEELARAPVTYKLQGAPELARARLAELTDRYLGARRQHFGIVLRQQVGAVSLHAIASTTLLTLGGLLVIDGQLTLGQLIAAELIVSIALSSFVKFGKQLEVFYDMLAGVDKLGALYDLPLEPDRGDPHAVAGEGARIELRDVDYGHPGRAKVVAGVSLAVEPGERVAILAPRGSGKSTLAELLCGLRDPDGGQVLFDGLDLRAIDSTSVRTQISLARGLEVVEGDVIDNVRLGRTTVSVDAVRAVLQRLGLLDELMALRDGLRTRVTVSGAPLSARTVRLLMLARSLVDTARVVVVDDVLDELGPADLARVVGALGNDPRRRTVIVFTARPDVAALLPRAIALPTGQPMEVVR